MVSTPSRSRRGVVYRDFQPIGGNRAPWYCHAPEMMVSGPAGTGKTRSLLELLHLRALKYDGMRGLIARKERTTLTQTALVTFDKQVRPDLDGVVWRTQEQEYRYPNGSVIVVAGLDKAAVKIMSGQYDLIYINEATELTEAEWENLTTRLRNGVMPYQQIFGDCNPDAPTHWLKQRADSGRTVMFESRHTDNPAVTPAYLAKLDALSGVRRKRLRDGIWAAAEGMVYEGWDPAIHLTSPFEIPATWPRYWSVDFGFTNPFVCQRWAIDPDGRAYLYREQYHTQRLVEDHAREVRADSAGEPEPLAVICDHDAEDRATFERHARVRTEAAPKAVDAGIQSVAARLKVAGDGKPRLFIFTNALVERDAELVEAHRPQSTAQEVDGYVWDTSAGRRRGEQPVKRDDHGMDALRYLCHYLDGGPRQGIWL